MKKFFLALFVCLLIGATALFLIQADLNSRLNTGDMQKQILFYEKINDAEGRLELFGQVYRIDLQKTAKLQEKARFALQLNTAALPSFWQSYLQQTDQQMRNLAAELTTALQNLLHEQITPP